MTRENEAIDWSAPIEAYHPDGRVVACELDPRDDQPDCDGDYTIDEVLDVAGCSYWKSDCTPAHDGGKAGWRIRNRKQWGDPIEVNGVRPVWLGGDGCTTAQALDPDLVDRMAWVIRRLNHGAFVTDDDITTAICDIAAELPPEPVDPVVARAREIVAGESDGSVAASFRAGERDDTPAVQAVIRALREGMGE